MKEEFKMYIIHVEDRFEPTAGYQINELVKEQIKYGNEVEIITSTIPIFSEPDELAVLDKEFQKNTKIKINRYSPKFVISSRYYFKDLFKIIDKKKPDVLFLHGIADFKDLILFKKKREYIIFRDCHMSWSASQNKFSGIFAKIYSLIFAKLINYRKTYSKIYSLGEEETQYLRLIGIKEDNIEPMVHGYNSTEIYYSEYERNKLRSTLHLKHSDCLIGYVGKFDNYKRPDKIFDVFNDFTADEIENIKFIFVGNFETKYKIIFEKKLANFKFKDRCIFYPSIPYNKLYKIYSALDICIWPKQTTLSSIHAQVCHCLPIMENEDSNMERVYYKEFLFEKDDIDNAKYLVRKAIKTYNDLSLIDMEYFCITRDYVKNVEIINEEWKEYIARK